MAVAWTDFNILLSRGRRLIELFDKVCVVEINYKSRRTVRLAVKSFSVTQKYGGEREYRWELAKNSQRVLKLGVDDIESVIQTNTCRRLWLWLYI